MTANFDGKGFNLFAASFSTSQGNTSYQAALEAWYELSYEARLAWGERAADSQQRTRHPLKWRFVTARISVDDHAVLASKAARDHISLSDLVRLILVDAVLDEREHAERLAARESRQSATSPAGSDSQPAVTTT